MQFIDLKAQYRKLSSEIDAGIAAVLNHGQYIMGAEVFEFERQMEVFCDVKHCVTCANGTDALQMLYMAYGICQGDAVFCPDITFIATIEPACMLGATPVFCDIRPDTYNICIESLERQIKAVLTEGVLKPKAVVAVDFLGNPADYAALEALCKKYDLLLIEDAAQSMGATYNGKPCGGFGNAAIASFFPAKPLGCYGDGGAVLTNDDDIAEICRSLRIHGQGKKGKYHNVRIGMNSRLDTLQAAILMVKLKALKDFELEARHTAAARYNKAFFGVFTIQNVSEGSTSPYAQYALLAKDSTQRNGILEVLKEAGIPSIVYYPAPLHSLEIFSGAEHYGEIFTDANDYCRCTFSLPMHPYLNEYEQERVISCVLGAL